MQFWQIVTISVSAIVLIAVLVWLGYRRRRTQHLQDHFGPEYDRTVSEIGNRWSAESELARREARVRKLNIRPLSVSDHLRFVERWKRCQSRFVDDPAEAVDEAGRLLAEVMQARGYSVENPDDRMADISAAYPERIADYREACEIAIRHRRRNASTEDLRKGFVHYRTLFDELLGGTGEELKRAS
jgi:hypothetical protein